MTGASLLPLLAQLTGAALAIAGVVWLVGWLGLGAPAPLDEAAALAIAAEAAPDFMPLTARLAPDRATALVVGRCGRHVVVRPHGARHIAILVEPAADDVSERATAPAPRLKARIHG